MAPDSVPEVPLSPEVRAVAAVIREFAGEILHSTYGLYLDMTTGMNLLVREITADQAEMRRSGKVPQGKNMDDLQFMYGRGDPAQANLLHGTTQGELKKRCAHEGENERRLVQLLIVYVYATWEDEYRDKLAKAAGLPSENDIKIPVFGDLKELRNEIVHHRGIITKATAKKLKILVPPEGPFTVGDEDVERMFKALNKGLVDWMFERYGKPRT
jgi:hypothetical protein